MGLIMLVLGVVFYIIRTAAAKTTSTTTAADNNSSSFNVTGAAFFGAFRSREAVPLYVYRRSRRRRGSSSPNSFIALIVIGGVLFLGGTVSIIYTLISRNVNYAAWAAANPGPALIFEAKGGYDGVTWLSETEAQSRTARFASGGGQQPTQVIVVASANEVAEQSKHTEVALPDAPPYAPYHPLFGAPTVEYANVVDNGGGGETTTSRDAFAYHDRLPGLAY
jgi:hypothetical protein